MKRFILLLVILTVSTGAYAQNDSKPDIKEIYYTNKSGERITKLIPAKDKKVFLNIVSTGAKGKEALLSLDEEEVFFYKKKFLAGGSSVKFILKSDLEIIKLTVYNPRKKKHVKKRMEVEGYAEAEDAKG